MLEASVKASMLEAIMVEAKVLEATLGASCTKAPIFSATLYQI